MYLTILDITYCAVLKFVSKIIFNPKFNFNQPACPLHPPTLDQHCDIAPAGAQDCHYAGDHCCCGRCFSSFVFSCVLDSKTGNSNWTTPICPAKDCGKGGELLEMSCFLISTNPLSQVFSPHPTSLTTTLTMLQRRTSSKCEKDQACL